MSLGIAPHDHDCVCARCSGRRALGAPSTPNLDELKELNRQLTMLLEDPQPGLFTWRLHLWDVLEKIAEFVK